ncbi:interleukin-21 isoform X1 [Ctenopharyngodon idella]|uniref:Interleukin n=2 Tax=Ctenopharyngodon idella TaxID=7959 RepID=A0A0E3XIA3_CTEID|nr:interleukin-21 isoform X1 [Ctenopharyngodon idella]AKC34877.1 interleukin 21 transcript variant X1 [Ctenopharyngodon idella]AKC34879.1 interleukin-21 [Ctenopharyngodon idella]
MKASVFVLFAVACWFVSQAELSPMQLTLRKVMNELEKVNNVMDKSTSSFNSPTTNDLKDCCIRSALECFRSQVMNLNVTQEKPIIKSLKSISNESRKKVIVEKLPSCNLVEGEKKEAQCKPCESYSKVNSQMFVQNFQTLLQKIYASQA